MHCTIAVIDVPLEEASRFGIMNTDDKGRILEFEEKPAHPKSTQASMGVYIFSTSKLINYLEEDEADPEYSNDFGKNVIPGHAERRAASSHISIRDTGEMWEL